MPHKSALLFLCLFLLPVWNCGKTQNQKTQSFAELLTNEAKKIAQTKGTAKDSDYTGPFVLTVKYAKADCKGVSPQKDDNDAVYQMTCTQNAGLFGCDFSGKKISLQGYANDDRGFGLQAASKVTDDLLGGTTTLVGKFSSKDAASGEIKAASRLKQDGKEGTCTLKTTFDMKRATATSSSGSSSSPTAKLAYAVNGAEGTRTFSDVQVSRSENGDLKVGAKSPVDASGNQERLVLSTADSKLTASTALFSSSGTPIIQGPLTDCEYKLSADSNALAFNCTGVSGSVSLPH